MLYICTIVNCTLNFRCRVRDGLKITGAISKADGPWQIHVDINERQKIGSVTAFIRDTSKYKIRPRFVDLLILLIFIGSRFIKSLNL